MFENKNLNLRNLCSVFMQVNPSCSFTSQEVDDLTDRIQNGGTEVVEVKHFLATLSLLLIWRMSLLQTPPFRLWLVLWPCA